MASAEAIVDVVIGPGSRSDVETTRRSAEDVFGSGATIVALDGRHAFRVEGGRAAVVVHAGDELLPGAALLLEELERTGEPVLLYGDDLVVVDEVAVRRRRPIWSPRRLMGAPYFAGAWGFRLDSAIVVAAGYSWESELTFAVADAARRKDRVPVPVVARRAAEGIAISHHLAAVNGHLRRTRPRATPRLNGDVVAVREQPADLNVRVSVVIPTRGTTATVLGREVVLAAQAIESLAASTAMPNLEFVIVQDRGTPESASVEMRAAARDHKIRFVDFNEPFNFSRKCNVGFLQSTGEIILLLNDDIRVVSERFLETLVAPLDERGVGMTGAFLVFEDDTVQHAGHWYSGRSPRHRRIGEAAEGPRARAELRMDREVSGLTAACVAIRRSLYGEVGGLSEDFPNNYNDADFSRKVEARGYRLIWMHGALAYHFESKTRDGSVAEWEREQLVRRWGAAIDDPYWPEDQLLR